MKRLVTWVLITGLVPFLLGSCMKDADSSTTNYVVNYGEIKTEGTVYQIVTDDGSVLTDGSSGWYSQVDVGSRVMAHYSILDHTVKETDHYQIRLYTIKKIPVKLPDYLYTDDPVSKRDSLGNDPIQVDEMWVAGKYLNINFRIKHNYKGTDHLFCLVVDEKRSTEKELYVLLTHNAYEESPLEWGSGQVAFDLRSLLPEGKESVRLRIAYVNYENSNYERTADFTWALAGDNNEEEVAIVQ